ncbi:MAG: putative polyprenyl synthase / dimethylallyltranstransferase [Frankiales bacterium]|nr:putative polyprenyl synthase / dimethylallyltranstransferase [Frankiales bacterium]
MGLLDRDDLRERVQGALDAFVAEHRPRLEAMAPELADMADAIEEFLSGGKRLRAGFCFWGHRGAGGADSDAIIAAAAALELFQACAIIHDDVMDGSETRRGRPAVHRRFADLHAQRGWQGDRDGFGRGAAILLGDLCLAWSDELLSSSWLIHDQARQVWADMRGELMGGQYLDLLEQVRGDSTVESALRVARFKSAKYTVVEPLHLGAALADAPQDVLDAYSSYGMPLGEAFQLRDDVLGVFGDPEVTGKPAGDDLREGKRTVLVAMALEAATDDQKALVRRHLGDPSLAADGVEELRDVLVGTGALARVEELIATRTAEALEAVDRAPIAEEAALVLRDLAAAATVRTT